MLEVLRLDHFAGCLNQTFRAALNDGDIEFVLVEARPLPATMPGGARDPFSLVFRNESALLFPQQIYRMSHGQVGSFDIFLVPIARDRDGFLYQAVFN